VLYTIGVNAYLDGYFREAIASFASALERYYEFALRVIARHKKIVPETFMKTWNFMQKLSERQYGAFIIVWMMETGKVYTQLSKEKVTKEYPNLRNGVIHKGNIPTPEECLKYGQYVIDIIEPIEKVLRTEYATDHKDECFEVSRKVSTQLNPKPTVLSIKSALDVALKSDDKKIDSVIARFKEIRKYKGIPIIDFETLKSQTITYSRKEGQIFIFSVASNLYEDFLHQTAALLSGKVKFFL
jgi:hypothetical protein